MTPRRPKRASQLATALIEHSSDAIALVDEAGTVLYANPATALLLGLPISEAVGSNIFRWVHEDDLRAFRAAFASQLAQAGVPVHSSFRLRHNDGSWRRIESTGVNRLDDPSIRGIITNYRDVTDAQLAREAAERSELRYRRLIEHASDIIYNCDLEGHFTFVNETAIRLMKYSEEELLGRHFLTLIRPDFQDRAKEFYERQRREAISSTYLEFPAVTKDGTDVWIGQNVQIQYEGDRAVGVQAIARDITARLALEEQLRQAQKMDAIGRLANGVAHDFNNVLMAILGSADFLASELDPGDPRREEAEAIRRAADRGADLTRRLLTFSRPHHLSAESVDLAAVVEQMEPMLKRLVSDNISIRVTGAGPIPVGADGAQLSQILLNLVVNARDAMPEGGSVTIEGRIAELAAAVAGPLGITAGTYGRLRVTDTGEGIDPAIQKHLFEPFFTTKTPDRGTGLGLSIVYGIAKSLGGATEVWSKRGKGTVFTVYLPLSVGSRQTSDASRQSEST